MSPTLPTSHHRSLIIWKSWFFCGHGFAAFLPKTGSPRCGGSSRFSAGAPFFHALRQRRGAAVFFVVKMGEERYPQSKMDDL